MKTSSFNDSIPVALGAASFGTTVPRAQAFRILDAYAEIGGRIIDTANNYAFWDPRGKGGDSERVVGEWLTQNDRAAFTVMTKIGSQPVPPKKDFRHVEGLSALAVCAATEKSLARLKVDFIDILLAHHDDWNTPLAETWKAFTELVTSGKVRQVGISNYVPQRVVALARVIREQSLAPVAAVQMRYSLLEERAGTDSGKHIALDAEMLRTLKRQAPHAVLFAYSPLLGGKIFDTPANAPWPAEYDTKQNRAKVAQIRRKARAAGVSPSAWVLKRIADRGLIPVTATSRVERLRENLQLFNA